MQKTPTPVIAVAVEAARSPDRGVKRTIESLMANREQTWLVLLQNKNSELISDARLIAWFRLAEACNVSAEHLISMDIN